MLLVALLARFWRVIGIQAACVLNVHGVLLAFSWRAALRAVREGPWATYGMADMRKICGIYAEYPADFLLRAPPGILQLGCVPPH